MLVLDELTYTTNGIDVSRAAIIFGEIATQTFVHIAGTKDKKTTTARSFANCWEKLGVKVGLIKVCD